MTFKDDAYLSSALEALLFVSDEPVDAASLADVLEMEKGDILKGLRSLQEDKRSENAGIQLRETASGWQLVTHAEHHDLIESYVRSWDTRKLSAAAMETLAIIAYMQPVTRAQVSSVRGVTSDSSISSLVEKGLVREVGSADTPGNPILYGTTRTFLDKFGLRGLDEMTDLAEFAPDEETERLIRERLNATRDEVSISDEEAARMAEQLLYDDAADTAIAGMVAAEAEVQTMMEADRMTQSADVDPVQKMMREALQSAAGVVEKIDFDELRFDTDDE